ncbi:MAG: redoxin domain-containing protein [Chloroflexi bacterium]|nr:redoxin domain-containing protein [Chloroflexota bacterium]MCI0577529.1 redoxin domain-containing protein [Chloroflexota bacterium]MCI0645632.1 redoxin domain-containing protein [Chloroflexota bacterium]MCI0725544.1 redoxin domain-containing protein [Chloroflexota bacterium]
MIPWVREWYDRYEGEDFTVIGVHYPEFSYEEKVENVLAATERLGVNYPVAIDNDGVTWRAYEQRFWPTRYVVDKQGHIRYKHIGEGAYVETEAIIQALMAEPDPP